MEKDNLNNIKEKPSPRKRKWLFLIIATPIIFLVLAFAFITYTAQDYSLPFIKYQGNDVGLKSFPQITQIVLQSDKKLKKDGITLSFDGKDQSKTFDELGVSVQTSKTADSIFSYGKKSMFISLPTITYFQRIFTKEAEVPIDIKTSSDTEKKLTDLFENSKKDAINPTLSVSGGKLIINKEEMGYKIDVIDFEKQVEEKLNSKTPTKIVLKKISTKSNINSSDLEHFRGDLESLVGKTVYLQSSSKKLLLTKEDITKFIDPEMTILDQKITLSDKSIEDYLNSVSKYFDIKGRTKKISSVDNSVLDEGSEGQTLDIAKSQTNIKDALQNSKKIATLEVTTSPIKEEVISPGNNPGKYPGKFIEVNLTQQMLYTFDGTQPINSYRVSTGKWSMPTPEGEYTINNKDPRAYSQEFGLYMPYWMAFIGSKYGIHELPEWPDGRKEGEDHLGTPVSHGCVRLGRGSAEEVYNWAEVGTPVFIHL